MPLDVYDLIWFKVVVITEISELCILILDFVILIFIQGPGDELAKTSMSIV